MPYKVNMADAISMGELLIDRVVPFRQRRRSAGDDQAGAIPALPTRAEVMDLIKADSTSKTHEVA
jgi:hypothetical protein